MQSTAGRRSQGRSGAAGAGWRGHGVEVAAALVLALGGLLGLAVWAKWGFLVAFDAVIAYCFG